MSECLSHRTSPLVCDLCGLNPNDYDATNCEVFTYEGKCKNCGSRPGDARRADLLAESRDKV